ncbi:UNVERIFIED_CONTAM: hypothetical protein ABID98_000863 [Brevibacillus sp. OAP136]
MSGSLSVEKVPFRKKGTPQNSERGVIDSLTIKQA